MSKRYQTTFTFTSQANADGFVSWIKSNANDRDYGYPKFVQQRQIGKSEFLVEYIAESDVVRGVATGIEWRNYV